MAIRVFVVSDHRLLLEALTDQLAKTSRDFILAGSCATLAQASELLKSAAADILLLDMDGESEALLAFISALQEAMSIRILLLTRHQDHALEDKAVVLGARGLIDRDTSAEQLLNALEKVHQGQVWLNREATGRVFVELARWGRDKPLDPNEAKMAQLTEREQHIVACIARSHGEPGKTIAEQLHISESTLRNHLTAIYGKLGVVNRHGLLAYAYQHGLAERLAP